MIEISQHHDDVQSIFGQQNSLGLLDNTQTWIATKLIRRFAAFATSGIPQCDDFI